MIKDIVSHSGIYRVGVLDKVSRVLSVMASAERGISLAELSHHLDMNKSTLHRLLMALCRHRFVVQDFETRRFRLGLRLFELGSQAVAGLRLKDVARQHLADLTDQTGETSNFVILDDGHALYLEKVESSRAVRTPSRVGWRAPVHCTAVGKAMLACLVESEVAKIIEWRGLARHTDRTITDSRSLMLELQRIRARGYAIDNEELENGLRCVAVPIGDPTRALVAAASVAGPSFRLTLARLPEVAAQVSACASAIAKELDLKTADFLASLRRPRKTRMGGSRQA